MSVVRRVPGRAPSGGDGLTTEGSSVDDSVGITVDMETFRTFLKGRPATEPLLRSYLDSLTTEWTSREWKAALDGADYTIRKTVCAGANADLPPGSCLEFFIGVKDDRSTEGTDLKPEDCEKLLRQDGAPRGDWFESDLNHAVVDLRQVPLGSGEKRVIVLEVAPTGKRFFLREKGQQEELVLYYRSGGSSRRAGSFEAIRLDRRSGRTEILRNCYLELKVMSERINESYDWPLGLPYLDSRLRDGSFYRVLTEDDRQAILGHATHGGRGIGIGFSGFLLAYERRIQELRSRWLASQVGEDDTGQEIAWSPLRRTYEEAWTQLADNLQKFRDYLAKNGVTAE